MIINVTQEHIEESKILRYKSGRRRCSSCPIALALIAAGFPKAEVGTTHAFPHGGGFTRCPIPLAATKFIISADKGYKVEPFSFEFNPNVWEPA